MGATNTGRGSGQVTDGPANTFRVFVDALGRLGYDSESLLATVGVRRSDLDDPDARVPCSVLPEILGLAMKQRPLKNLAARLAAETPIGTFEVVDYLVITSETRSAVGLAKLGLDLRPLSGQEHMGLRLGGDTATVA